jgi:hypothetical protein
MTSSLSESSIHRRIAAFLSRSLRPPAWFTTFPLGGGGEMRAKINKSAGLKRGVPDCLIIFRGLAHWGEIKTAKGTLSEIQQVVHRILVDCGCRVAVWRSVDDCKSSLEQWQIPWSPVSETTERIIRTVREFNQFGE